MTYDPDYKLIDENGKRLDGRGLHDLRPIKIEAGVLKRANGSAYLEWGENKVLAAVYGPREVHPRHQQQGDKAIVRLRYNMAPFSVGDRKRPGPDRRSQEISKISSEALEAVVITKPYPKTAIDVFVEVLEASAGTRCAGLTAASVALADAGIPMRDLVTACASGKINDKIALDLGKAEDNFGQADVPMGVIVRTGEVVLLQMDGDLTVEEFKEACSLTMEACKKIYELQKAALKNRYLKEVERVREEEEERARAEKEAEAPPPSTFVSESELEVADVPEPEPNYSPEEELPPEDDLSSPEIMEEEEDGENGRWYT